MSTDKHLRCSFCGKSKESVKKFISGNSTQASENLGMLRGCDQIVDLVRIAGQIVQLFGRFFLPKVRLLLVEFSCMVHAVPNLSRWRLEHVV